MLQFLLYDLKAAILIAIFYMCYRLLLAHEKMHHVNRVVLLGSIVLSFVLPLCVITTHEVVTVSAVPSIEAGMPKVSALIEEEARPWWLMPLGVLFITGGVVTLCHSLLSLVQLVRFISKNEHHPQSDGTVVVVTDSDTAPFSWMKYIVLSRADYLTFDAAILTHERGHIRHHHSLDVLFTYLVTPLQWFNPALWLLRSDLRSIHEFEADKEVLSHGINVRQYQLMLVNKAMAAGGYTAVNSLSHSTLQKRIKMMLRKEPHAKSYVKLLFALPIIAASLVLNAKTETTYRYTAPDDVVQAASPSPTPTSLETVQSSPADTEDGYLYIVDGKQMTDISGISPNEIESMTILKGERARQFGYNRDVIIVKLKKDTTAETSTTGDGGMVYDVCDQMPEFPGGMNGMMDYLMSHVKYPEAAYAAGKQGRVLVSFVINKNGEVGDVSIAQSVEEHLDMEALRVVSEMPNWTPGMNEGKCVSVRYTLPIKFSLKGTSQPANDAQMTTGNADEDHVKVSTAEGSVKVETGTGHVSLSLNGNTSENDITVYIDDVKKTIEELKALPASSIDHISVDKSGGKGIIRVYTKPKDRL